MKTVSNVIRFPIELCRLDIDALSAIEPDVMLADELSAKFDLDILPFDSIECGEIEARRRIDELRRVNPLRLVEAARQMNAQAIGLAIDLCRQAATADAKAARLRALSGAAGASTQAFFERIADNAEYTAAALTLSAIAASHRAHGIDAVVAQTLRRVAAAPLPDPPCQPDNAVFDGSGGWIRGSYR